MHSAASSQPPATSQSPAPVPDPYRILRNVLFRMPAESAHELTSRVLRAGLGSAAARRAARASLGVEHPSLRSSRWGIDFENPLGLAAGFDKEGRVFDPLAALGFGYVEIGTITAVGQTGNERPRLFRLPRDRALLNRMGFNNAGAAAVARRLSRRRPETVLGINIGKSKITPLESAEEDYLRSLELLAGYADYLVVNVSSPNTPGLRSLQDAAPLRSLIRALVGQLERQFAGSPPPLLLKLAPDLTDPQLLEAVDIAAEEAVSGVVAVNTTVSRDGLKTSLAEVDRLGAGGISGAPLRSRATEAVRLIHRHTGGEMPIIGVGGIATAEDAWQRILAGASLLQVYTGFIYEGPRLIPRVLNGLAERLERAGLKSLDDAVGAESAT